MVLISDLRTGEDTPSIWVEDSYCTSNSCKISSSVEKSREYVVRVTATDEAGNSNTTECKTFAGQTSNAADPLFLITKLDIVGGVEPADSTSTLFQ